MKFIGNTKHIINWDNIIEQLNQLQPAYVGPRHNRGDKVVGLEKIFEEWDAAGLKLLNDNGTIGWDMFFPDEHFSKTIVKKLSNFCNIEPLSAWISKVHPGNQAALHWDANDDEEYYSQIDNIERYHCHISRPDPGHILIVEDVCLHNQKQGDLYKWPARTSWHAGGNCGLTPKFTFNLFGIKK